MLRGGTEAFWLAIGPTAEHPVLGPFLTHLKPGAQERIDRVTYRAVTLVATHIPTVGGSSEGEAKRGGPRLRVDTGHFMSLAEIARRQGFDTIGKEKRDNRVVKILSWTVISELRGGQAPASAKPVNAIDTKGRYIIIEGATPKFITRDPNKAPALLYESSSWRSSKAPSTTSTCAPSLRTANPRTINISEYR